MAGIAQSHVTTPAEQSIQSAVAIMAQHGGDADRIRALFVDSDSQAATQSPVARQTITQASPNSMNQNAAFLFHLEVRKTMKDCGFSYDDAYNFVMRSNPSLYNLAMKPASAISAMANVYGGKHESTRNIVCTNATPRLKAALGFSNAASLSRPQFDNAVCASKNKPEVTREIVATLQAQCGTDYDGAWQLFTNAFPEISGAPPSPGTLPPENQLAGIVHTDPLFNVASMHLKSLLGCHPACSQVDFLNAIDRAGDVDDPQKCGTIFTEIVSCLKRGIGLSYDEAWTQAKRSYPKLVAGMDRPQARRAI